MTKIKLLNLYAGIGGNVKYLDRTKYEITSIENNEQIAKAYKINYPQDNIIIINALEYLIKHFEVYDMIWASPPCQTHSKMRTFTRHKIITYRDMDIYKIILFLKDYYKGKWVVENVQGDHIIPFDIKIGRHVFWSNGVISHIDIPKLKNFIKAKREQLVSFLDLDYEGNIYYRGNHDHCQILRNAVHPKLGGHVIKCLTDDINKQEKKCTMTGIFECPREDICKLHKCNALNCYCHDTMNKNNN